MCMAMTTSVPNHGVTVASHTTEIWLLIPFSSTITLPDTPRNKFKNRAPKGCSPGPMLWPPTISFELHSKTPEEIDLEKCNFRNFRSSVTLTLTLDRVEVTLVRIRGRGLPTHQIRRKSEKLFCGRTDVWTDGRTHLSSNLLGHR